MHVLIFLLQLELLFKLSSKLLLALPKPPGASCLRENREISYALLLARRVLYHKSGFDSTTTRRPALLLVYSPDSFE